MKISLVYTKGILAISLLSFYCLGNQITGNLNTGGQHNNQGLKTNSEILDLKIENSKIQAQKRDKAINLLNEFESHNPFGYLKFAERTPKRRYDIINQVWETLFKEEKNLSSGDDNYNKYLKDTEKIKEKEKLWRSNLKPIIHNAQQHLINLAEKGDYEAEFYLAEQEMYGKGGFPMNLKSSFLRWKNLAQNTGNSTAQFMLAIFYSTGLGGVSINPGLAHTYLNVASLQGNSRAQLMLAHRYMNGIETSTDCIEAVNLYSTVTRKSVDYYYSGPHLGRNIPKQLAYIYHNNNGIYGVQTDRKSKTSKKETKKEVISTIEYYKFKAGKGDIDAHLRLANLYQYGGSFVKIDYDMSYKYMTQAANLIFNPGTITIKNPTLEKVSLASMLCELLGKAYLNGNGVDKDYIEAMKWFKAGTAYKSGPCCNALGYMYHEGLGVDVDFKKGTEFFKKAADLLDSNGFVNFGLTLYNSNPSLASEYFTKAMVSGNFRGYFYGSELHKQSGNTKIMCKTLTLYYRAVAYGADWEYSLTPEIDRAIQNKVDSALLIYNIIAAEMGYKAGIANSAYLLEKYNQKLEKDPSNFLDFLQFKNPEKLAAIYWTRAANMNVPDARVKQGDYYYYGKGVEKDESKAASAYLIASETEGNALAMWNLAYMYEFGIGVKRDFHMAKRWYDQSSEYLKSGTLAAGISMARLAVNYYIAKISGENVGSGPLFMAPPPKSHNPLNQDKIAPKKKKNINNDNADDKKDGFNLHGKENAQENDGSNFEANTNGLEDNEVFAKVLLSDYHIIIALCLLLGYLVLIRNRRAARNEENNERPA
ncbi:hypothetical protein BB558_000559 [Smittium angustum]|uniref:Uncharacterized protein n=1 Tax=Smittium angustum TaxID=133377 RepID=A0A2U1JDP7_SMIAN|nr:hypothetical protein BB558_000559 [Smittium angustum]